MIQPVLPTINGNGQTSQSANTYTMPAESALHSHTLMAFPSIDSVENEDDLLHSQQEVISIANTIAAFEPVHLYTREDLLDIVRSRVAPNVFVKTATVDQLWIRDSGPTYVYNQNGQRTAVDFNFNYWGNKVAPTGDQKVASQIAEQEAHLSIRSQLIAEGGAIEHDGEGTFLGTESSLINENRNAKMDRTAIEAELQSMLGVTNFIWVPGVKDFDITDYHIDILARFIRPGVVILSKPAPNAPTFAIKAYNEAKAIIASSKDARGQDIVVYTCEEPDTSKLGTPDKYNEVVASYVNYHLVNGAVILPKYGQDGPDGQALELLEQLFPSRKVVQVYINRLPRTGGGIHCATQQVIPEFRCGASVRQDLNWAG